MDYLLSKALKSLKFLKRNNPLVFIFIGLSIFLFGAINYHRVRVLSFKNSPQPIISTGQKPIEIIIPSLNIDLPIEQGKINNSVWEISQNSATHLADSANPEDNGNIVIYGHNKKSIFGNLPYLKIGETINIKVADGQIYKYKLEEKLWVKPDRVDLVSPTDHEVLTIYTCWGFLDSQRVILKAVPIKQ